jgi:CDP-diacylglycerol--serine O-phosphatidyltransferase
MGAQGGGSAREVSVGTRDDRVPSSRAAAAVPTAITLGNALFGVLAVASVVQGTLAAAAGHDPSRGFRHAGLAIVGALLCDGLDGRVARSTGTTSPFGRELDSLADAISFGVAPGLMALCWGVRFVDGPVPGGSVTAVLMVSVPIAFVLCGLVRLARFNVGVVPPSNPGRADRTYAVGLPIPVAACAVAVVVFVQGGRPLDTWQASFPWLGLVAVLSGLMVTRWRYRTFRELRHAAWSPWRLAPLAAVVPLVMLRIDLAFGLGMYAFALSGPAVRAVEAVRSRA